MSQHAQKAASRRTRWPRGAILLSAPLAFAIGLCPMPVSAVPSEFAGVIQVASGLNVAKITDHSFLRQQYTHAGASVNFRPWLWVPELGDWTYAVSPGETWTWVWTDNETQQVVGTHEITYIGGDSHCWSNGNCGTFNSWWAALHLQCIGDDDRIRVDVYHNANPLGGDSFGPTPFEPEFVGFGISPDEIRPELPETQQNRDPRSYMPGVEPGSATIYVQLADNIGCGTPIAGASVTLSNTVVAESGGHLHFSAPTERGTGEYVEAFPGGGAINGPELIGETDVRGQFHAFYRAGTFGVEESVTAEIAYAKTNYSDSADGVLTIRVPGLIPLDETGADYVLRGSYGVHPVCNDQAHNNGPTQRVSHYVQAYTYGRIREMAQLFRAETGITLSLNDAGLPLGGFFDWGDNTNRDRNCHWTHREGVDVDVNVGAAAGCPDGYNLNCPVGTEHYPPSTTRRQLLDHISTVDLYGYKWIEPSLHYRFTAPTE